MVLFLSECGQQFCVRLAACSLEVENFIRNAQERRGIEQIFPLVDPVDPEINQFFTSLGFTPGKMKHLQRRIVP